MTDDKGQSTLIFKGKLVSPVKLLKKDKHYVMVVIGSQTTPTTEQFWIGWEPDGNQTS